MTRRTLMVAALGGLAALVASGVVSRTPLWIWNASASVPEGLYRLQPARRLQVGDLVAAAPPERLASFLTTRNYLPRGAVLLKPVAALPGQTVCRTGVQIRIDDAPTGEALLTDRRGRSLPAWSGCRRLGRGELFLMNPAVRDSFDGRYFGVLPTSALIGRATPVWLPSGAGAPGRRRASSPLPAPPPTAGDPIP